MKIILKKRLRDGIVKSIFDIVNNLSKIEDFEKTTTRFVYVAEFQNGEIKIGMSKTPKARLRQLERQERTTVIRSYFRKFYDAPKVEKLLLKSNSEFLTYGNEYFRNANYEEIVRMIDSLFLKYGCEE